MIDHIYLYILIGLLLFKPASGVSQVNGSNRAATQLVQAIGVDDIQAEIIERGEQDFCVLPVPISGEAHEFYERCQKSHREQVALDLAEKTFAELQKNLCADEKNKNLHLEDCAPPIFDFYKSIEELYQSTCEAHCQSIVPPSAQSKINCSDGIKCRNLFGRESELLSFGQGCFDGVKDGGGTVLAGLEAFAATPVNAYSSLVQITEGIFKMGFHDFVQRDLYESEQGIRASVRLAKAFPEMLKRQLKVLRCMDSEVGRRYICHFGTVAGAVAAQMVLVRRVGLAELEGVLSKKAFERLEGKTPGQGAVAPLGSLRTTDEVVEAFIESANGKKLKGALDELEFEVFRRGLRDIQENPNDAKMMVSLIDEMSDDNLEDLVSLIKDRVNDSSIVGGMDPAIKLRNSMFPFLVQRHSRQLGGNISVSGVGVSSDFLQARQKAARVDTIEELPNVDSESLQTRRELTDGIRGGTGYQKIEKGELNGKAVFIKTSRAKVNSENTIRSTAEVVNEGRMAALLERLGIGPKYHGTTVEVDPQTRQQHYVTVTEYLDGEAFSGNETMLKTVITQSMIDDIRKSGHLLNEAGIEPNDIQFQLTRDGRAVLIDPEMFDFVDLRDTEAIADMEALAQRLEAVRLLQSRQNEFN